MFVSVIIPAYNEESYLATTLEHIKVSEAYWRARRECLVETLVVDNGSTDDTASIALKYGATLVREQAESVARARNSGARRASGKILVFIDADTTVPEPLLWQIGELVRDRECAGGAVDTAYRPARFVIKVYLRLWRWLGRITGMAQGATQFCRREVFDSLGGYDESLYMGEDVDFYWRMLKLAKSRGLYCRFLTDNPVVPSTRRFDQWPLARTLLWTNPLLILLFRRRKRPWKGWYGNAPR